MQSKEWTKFYTSDGENSKVLKWPNEMMIISLFGKKPFPINFGAECKVLDVGCGSGNNMLPFLDAGCQSYGVELSENIIELAKNYLHSRGYEADFKVGNNRQIPYDDNSFDLVTSINVLHYESTEDLIIKALREYSRVLKPGGLLYLSTTGPNHMVYQAAELIGDHQYCFGYNDFRKGQNFFYFDNERYLERYLSEHFSKVQTGMWGLSMMDEHQDYIIAIAQK